MMTLLGPFHAVHAVCFQRAHQLFHWKRQVAAHRILFLRPGLLDLCTPHILQGGDADGCAGLRENQLLIISDNYSRRLSGQTLAELVALCQPACCSDVPLVYYNLSIFAFTSSFWQTSLRCHFLKIFCHGSACRSNRIYCHSHLLPGFSLSGWAAFSKEETSVTSPAAFKRRAVTISNQLGTYLHVNEACVWAW